MDDLELLGDFVEEAREHLGDIEIQLLQIEAMGEAIDDTLVNTVFIAIHSVKGASGFLGLTQINAVSHRLEDVLARVREKQLVPDTYIVAVMLKAADRLKSMIESIETSEASDNTVICENLEAILSGDLPQETASSPQNAASAQAPEESANENKPTDRRGSAAEPKTPTPKSRKTSRNPNQPAPQSGVSDRVSESLDQIDSAIQSVSQAFS